MESEYQENEIGHRHISHLYALFPSNQIKDKELINASILTLNKRLKYGGGHTGWSKAWITAMLARLKMGNESIKSINEFIAKSTSRTGLDLHPPFQIDGNFGIARAISELIINDDSKTIEIHPALPDEGLESGIIKGFLLKGNIIINLEWDNNKIKYIELENHSNKPKLINLKYQNKTFNFILDNEKIINF